SSGLRINSAKDDAAGMAVRELLRADIAVLKQGSRNALDGISMLQTMEAAMGIMNENLIRMKELAEQAATGSYSAAQRTIMDAEFAEMAYEIERIAGATKFNGIAMLNEAALSSGSNDVKIHVGTTTTIDVERTDMTKSGLNIETGDGGWRVTADTANGVTATSLTYITVKEGCAATAGGLSLNISFEDNDTPGNDESDIVAAFTAVTDVNGTNFSLAAVVSTINAASNNLGFDASGNDLRYSAAEAYYDSSSSKYVLRISSRDSTSDKYSIFFTNNDASGGTKGSVCGAFTVTADDGSTVVSSSFANSGVTTAGLNIKTVDAATTALLRIATAIDDKDTARAAFGYKMNRLESTVSILDVQVENLMTAESRISDVDVATEMAMLTSSQVLSQAGVSMLAQANSMPNMALTLLR
ncbi:MAG: hypothetical protein IIA65_09720, partial [Planctomycetes bacterium]|nr:hypothetical protein [Planctomycetota bacterium]